VCAMRELFWAACVTASISLPVVRLQAPGIPRVKPHAAGDGNGPVAFPARESEFYRIEPVEGIQFVAPGDGDEYVEGEQVTIFWLSAPDIRFVKLSFFGDRTPLGGRSRGEFHEAVTGTIPNKQFVVWTVPWIDAARFTLRIVGFDEQKQPVARDERAILFRPRVMKDIEGTCIVISRARQRLYYQEDGLIKRIHVISTAARGYRTPQMGPSDHYKGRVFRKLPNPYSHLYECHMPYFLAITSSGSHGIHATSRPFYRRLGRPASHGCIRQHRADARTLFQLVKIGTPVYVF